MGIVRGTVRAASAVLEAITTRLMSALAAVLMAVLTVITTLAVLAQPASAEPDVQISTVCTDAGNRRIRLKQDTDLLVQWFLDGTPYLEPSTDVVILTSVPGDGKEHVIELKEMPDKIVLATFEVTFEFCEQPTVTTQPPATTTPTTAKPTTTKQVPTTASTTPSTVATSSTTADASTSTTTAISTTTEPGESTSTTERDDRATAGNGAEMVLGALAAIRPDIDQTSAQTLPPDDILTPPPSLAASDDPSLADDAPDTTGSTATGDADDEGSMSGAIVVIIVGVIAAGLVGLLIGRRSKSPTPAEAGATDPTGVDAPTTTMKPTMATATAAEALPSAQELLAARTGAKPVFSEPPRGDEPLPQRQRSPKS